MEEVTYSKPMRGKLLLIAIIGILLIIGIAIGATYAFFQYNKIGTKTLSFETGSINLQLGEVGNGITLTDQFPMSDEAGISQATTYNFTISGYNTGTEPIYYEVVAVPGGDVAGKTRFNDDEIKLYITDGTGVPVYGPTPTFELSNSESKLFIDTIPGGTPVATPVTRSYFLRIWLNSERILISETDYVSGKNRYTPTEFQSKYASVKIQVKGDMTPKTIPTLLEKINTNLSANFYNRPGDSDQTFIVGTSSDDNYKPNNYLWYSGKLWRIVTLNKTSGTVTSIKLITQDNITSISWNGTLENGGSGGTTYQDSFIYQWLNENFYETLRYPTNYLVTNYSWNATSTYPDTKPPKTIMVLGAVGLLNIYEYTYSSINTTLANGYLNTGYEWCTITSYDTENVRYVLFNGSSNSVGSASNNYSVRPSINLKTTLRIINGNGTINNPYRLAGDNDQESSLINDNLNTRYSGEYVRFNDANYRIVEVENGKTKLLKQIT